MRTLSTTFFCCFAMAVFTNSVNAHFPWLIQNEDGKIVYFFGEGITDRTYHMPESLAKAEIKKVNENGDGESIKLASVEDANLIGLVSTESFPQESCFVSQATFGIYHGARLDYYMVHDGRALSSSKREDDLLSKTLPLSAQLVDSESGINVYVTWKNEPLAGVEVRLYCEEGHEEGSATTDASGMVSFTAAQVEPGLNALMLGQTIDQEGSLEGKSYTKESHYLTYTFKRSETTNSRKPAKADVSALPPLPFAITSFGAARLGNVIFVYGGHTGTAHSYWNESQSNKLLKLDLDNPQEGWKEIATGERLQGLGMVAHENQVIVLGGFIAKNAKGDQHDLHSQSTVRAYDLAINTWKDLPSLPEPRSSHDAVMIGSTIYVVGGWNMSGENETEWHSTAWAFDLSKDDAQWQSLPTPPFKRRALATIAHEGKLFVVGGMNETGGPTKSVAIFDPATDEWIEAAELLGESGMAGFGAAGYSIDSNLIVTTYEGSIQQYNSVENTWSQIGKTQDARFFHRLLPINSQTLVSIGGANMEEGKYLDLEIVDHKQ